MRTVVLLLSGVLPLAIQPSALAGQIAASRNVDRMVSDLPEPLSIDELARLLAESTNGPSKDADTDGIPADVLAVIAQCKLMSMMSESVVLQAPDVDTHSVGLEPAATREFALQPCYFDQPAVLESAPDAVVRRLCDEQPLGP